MTNVKTANLMKKSLSYTVFLKFKFYLSVFKIIPK